MLTGASVTDFNGETFLDSTMISDNGGSTTRRNRRSGKQRDNDHCQKPIPRHCKGNVKRILRIVES